MGFGGAEKVFVGLVNRLDSEDLGSDVKICSILNKSDYKVSSNININFLSKKKRLNPLLLPFYLFKFLSLCLKLRPSLVQSHLFWSNYINIICSFFCNYDAQVVHCVSFDSKFKKGATRFFHFVLSRILFNKASLNIFKSYEMRDEYVSNFNIDISKTVVIYNPVSLKVIKSKTLNVSKMKDTINIALVGRFHRSKRYLDLLDIAKSLRVNACFHCIGEGEQMPLIQQKVQEGGLHDAFRFYGWMENPSTVLDECDIYLSCSESEGFPNALIEAMSRGLIPIHSNCKTGPREILGETRVSENGYDLREAGITFPVGDICAAARAIENIACNKVDSKFILNNSISRANGLSEHDSYEDYIELLK